MSRDFIGSLDGRSFRQSPNRDRVTRAGLKTAPWAVRYEDVGLSVLFDGGDMGDAPPGHTFEDFRTTPTRSADLLFPPAVEAHYVRRGGQGDGGTQVVEPFANPGIASLLPPGHQSSFLYRLTLRCWGVCLLSDAYGFPGLSFVTRLGSRTAPADYPPPEITVYDKNPLISFNALQFGLPNVIQSVDFNQFGGVPVNALSVTGAMGTESKSLYHFDRIIRCSVTISPQFVVGGDLPLAFRLRPMATNEIEGGVVELQQSIGGSTHFRFAHFAIREPNRDLLNPSSPVVILTGDDNDGTHVFRRNLTESQLYDRMGLMVYPAPMERITSYEPPSMDILSQEELT